MWTPYLAGICCLVLLAEGSGQTVSRERREGNKDEEPVSLDPVPNNQRKKEPFPDGPYVEETINRPGSSLGISHVKLLESTRVKRQSKKGMWSYLIPYVIDTSFSNEGGNVVKILKRAIQRIMENVCVVYQDVTDTWNRSNSNWFKENGFDNNAYILIKKGAGCSSGSGYSSQGAQVTFPCFDYQINTHEMLHTLGGGHNQQLWIRDRYITINRDNIKPNLQYTYNRADKSDVEDQGFDSRSMLIYPDKTWTRNGLPTYSPIRDDMFELNNDVSTDHMVFYELSQRFKCNEVFCKNVSVDCGLGYHTLSYGECKCVCPPEFDPATNCQTLIDKHNSIPWPQTPIGVFAGGPENECPEEFTPQPGWITFDGTKKVSQKDVPVQMPYQMNTLLIPVCTKDGPKPPLVNWESWPPGGSFCACKSIAGDCGGAFEESTFHVQSSAPISYNGSIGDTRTDNSTLSMKLCCKDQEYYSLPVDLPNSRPFRLLSVYDCPRINGMRFYKGSIYLYSLVKSVEGSVTPRYYNMADHLRLYQCYFLPPLYGCNREITLDSQTKSVTVTTPGFGVAREPNTRCLYYFKVPKDSKIRITFNKYDMGDEDMFMIKRYFKWQVAYKIDNSKPLSQFVSEKDYLTMEYWSSWQNIAQQGVNFTADVLLPEDHCYDTATNGADYYGETNLTETYEECMPWSEAVGCTDFPSDGMDLVWLLRSKNMCRNPGGQLVQPWCYTSKNGTNCKKRYCDVCNFNSPVDVLGSCSDLLNEDPDFCNSGIQRFGCFKSCGMVQTSTDRATCQEPNLPADGVAVGPLKTIYQQGEKVQVTCAFQPSDTWQSEMLCTKSGWTSLSSACIVGDCLDTISKDTCEELMSVYPNFCNEPSFINITKRYCKKSCGLCTDNEKCSAPASDSYTTTPDSYTISAGQVMTHNCSPDLYHVSGDLIRACSSSGSLLGKPPVCQYQPEPRDINMNAVELRKDNYPKGLALLLTPGNISVPFNGKITKWYYICANRGIVYFLVYRQKGSSYLYVGSNNATCQTGWKWSLNVPSKEQILVQKDDIIGVYSPDSSTFSSSVCGGSFDMIVRYPYAQGVDFNSILSQTFTGEKCLIPSVGYRVDPDNSYTKRYDSSEEVDD